MLTIGEKLILEPKYAANKESYKCMIVEMGDGTFFIDYPVDVQTGKVVFLMDGTELKASYQDSEKGTYLFDTEVFKKVKGNIPMIQLLLPPEDMFIRIQRRQFVRIETSIDVAIHSTNGEFSPFRTVTEDLSAGGAAIRMPKNVKLGDVAFIQIWLALPLNSGEIVYMKLVSKVIRIVTKNNGLTRLSVQFVAPAKHETQIIMRYIFERQAEMKKRGLIV
jgi:c-di-GMP-binding flagellar brake protein YcgR